jgi:hypothetical protein
MPDVPLRLSGLHEVMYFEKTSYNKALMPIDSNHFMLPGWAVALYVVASTRLPNQ